TPDGGTRVRYRADEKSDWKPVVTWGPEDADGSVIGFTADGGALWLNTSAGRDTLAVVKHDPASSKEEVIAAAPKADASNLPYTPETYEVEAVAFNRERVRWQPVSPKVADDFKALAAGAPGEPSVVSRDRADQTWVVAYSADLKPTTYYLYDRGSKKLTKLFE